MNPIDKENLASIINSLKSKVVSYCPGRIRLRLNQLKDEALAEKVKARIKAEPGVASVEVNKVTGGILIEYDAKAIDVEKLLENSGDIFSEFSELFAV